MIIKKTSLEKLLDDTKLKIESIKDVDICRFPISDEEKVRLINFKLALRPKYIPAKLENYSQKSCDLPFGYVIVSGKINGIIKEVNEIYEELNSL
ncbi:MAG TPA: hypothetical protein HA283_00410 [Nanoarchaeota archaeon]|nr:hypothetical protein [Nanoarchaeota archaeon]HIH62735.1 hypothetical protein [Nanoarchaeota archaeon]HIJ09140.1 hypothetical protein [Nanoarchaeota archaeon]